MHYQFSIFYIKSKTNDALGIKKFSKKSEVSNNQFFTNQNQKIVKEKHQKSPQQLFNQTTKIQAYK